MNDVLLLVVFFIALAVIAAISSGDPLAWVREEWRRVRAPTWAPGAEVSGPTVHEDRAQRLLRKQRALAKRMRRKGRHLYANKAYTPALTVAVPPAPASAPPRADRVVVPIDRKKRA